MLLNMSKKLTLTINRCIECPNHEVLPDPDPSDWFNRDDCRMVCKQIGKEIAGALRPYEVKNIEIPKWCPF